MPISTFFCCPTWLLHLIIYRPPQHCGAVPYPIACTFLNTTKHKIRCQSKAHGKMQMPFSIHHTCVLELCYFTYSNAFPITLSTSTSKKR